MRTINPTPGDQPADGGTWIREAGRFSGALDSTQLAAGVCRRKPGTDTRLGAPFLAMRSEDDGVSRSKVFPSDAMKDRTLSRRHFLVGAALGLVALLSISYGPRVRRWYKRRVHPLHVSRPPDGAASSTHVLETTATFCAALHGHENTREDRQQLIQRLRYAEALDGGWAEEYRSLTARLDQLALREEGRASFLEGDAESRERILGRIMEPVLWSIGAKCRALWSPAERSRRLARLSTIEHLGWLYRNSPVPWRVRGYSCFPGNPGDPLAYTRPGGTYA